MALAIRAVPTASGTVGAAVVAAVPSAAESTKMPRCSWTTVIANFASTHQCRKKPHGVAEASMNPVNADALASGASRVWSTCSAMPVAAARTALSPVVRARTSRLAMASAWPIHPTEVMTCSQRDTRRHRLVRWFAMPTTLAAPGARHIGDAPEDAPGGGVVRC